MEKQSTLLLALAGGLALTTLIFLVAFLIYRTKALELEHGIGKPPAEETR